MSIPASNEPSLSCSFLSRQAGEPLFATATHTRAWLLLEYPPPWGSQAFKESNLPADVKQRLTGLLETIPSSRLQFIYRRAIKNPGRISFFIGSSDDTAPYLYEIPLHSYEDLLDLDISAILNGNLHNLDIRRHEFLLLVCTNGRRDPCCALNGLPVFKQLSKLEPDATWQTIHVGGHRFAANIVWFPHGLYFGRLSPAEAIPFLDACRNGQIYLPNYRGRASYLSPAQAADYFLRIQTGSQGIGTYRVKASERIEPNRWQVILHDQTSGQGHLLVISEHGSELSTLQSCRDSQPTPVTLFNLESYQELSGVETGN